MKLKRIFDLAACVPALALATVIAVPTMAVMAIDTRSWNPVFVDERVGKDGKHFKMYKIRTMRGEFNEAGRRLTDEERTSRLAAWVRRHGLDESLQVINIAKGDMSFVGPRPHRESDSISKNDKRQSVVPGLTSPAQLEGGNSLSLPEVLKHDHAYIDYVERHGQLANFIHDLAIMARTIPLILRGKKHHYRPPETEAQQPLSLT